MHEIPTVTLTWLPYASCIYLCYYSNRNYQTKHFARGKKEKTEDKQKPQDQKIRYHCVLLFQFTQQ